MRYRRRANLKPEEIESLKGDLARRAELRAVMSENSSDVLVLEFGVSLKAIQRIDRRGAVFTRYSRLKYETVQALHRRRQLYWQARELHDKHFSRKVIAERYDIDMTTIKRYTHAMQDERRQVDEDFRAEKVAA